MQTEIHHETSLNPCLEKSLIPLELYPDLPSLLRIMADHYFKHLSRDENGQLKQHSQPLIIFTTRAGLAACLELFFRSLVEWDKKLQLPEQEDEPMKFTEEEKKVLRSRVKCLHSRTQHQQWNKEFCENPNEIIHKVSKNSY